MRVPRRVCFFKPVLLGLLILPTTAMAAPPVATRDVINSDEPKEFRYEFGLTAGVHFFNKKSGLGRTTGDSEDLSPATNVALGGRLALNFNRWVSVEGEALAIPTHNNGQDPRTTIWAFAYRGNLNIHLVPTGPIRPFITLGYGAISTVVNDTSVVRADIDGMFHAGVGFKISLGEHAGIRLEGRVLAPPAILGSSIPVGNETGYDGPDWEALGGLYLNFGEVERTSQTIVNNETIVKREVVNMPPPPPPLAPPDPDGDGIAGDADKCPNVAEDKDGFEDDDGCPDPDNDKDGIPDLRDKCPNEPETVNGYQDEDGCPDEVPAAVKKFTGVIEGINFKTAQATILPGSYAILDRAVAVLKEYQDIRMEIAGHTDSRGKADYNRDLSQRRADAVKMYFIANGIDASRLTSVGYGLDRPIADNRTESGRSKNRRTEFRLLMGDEGKPAAAPRGDSGPPSTPGDSGPPPPMKP